MTGDVIGWHNSSWSMQRFETTSQKMVFEYDVTNKHWWWGGKRQSIQVGFSNRLIIGQWENKWGRKFKHDQKMF